MILPFVRELFADVEKSAPFARSVTHLKTGAGRIRVSGLTPTAKAIYLALLQHALGKPLVVVVSTNRAAEQVLPVLQAACELTGGAKPEQVLSLPAYDVLPYQNMSPHPEIQEQRASTLWKLATADVRLLVVPMPATLMRMRGRDYYAGLGRVLRRGESIEPESLVTHLNTVGYMPADVVEMPGQYALRGGILDIYSPEADRPVRVEFFGDEIETMRKFDPGTQRSAAPVDELAVLPLTETPVDERTLGAIHARLSGARISGERELLEAAASASGATVFPGWELYAPLAGSEGTVFDLLSSPVVMLDEETLIRQDLEAWWEKLAAVHEKSGVGKLAEPQELYLTWEQWELTLGQLPGGSVEHLGISSSADLLQLSFNSRPTTRFHGSVPAMIDEVKELTAQGKRVIFAVPNTGEAERLADVFSEYQMPFRLGSRQATGAGESYLDETAYFATDLSTTTIVKAYIPEGTALDEANLALFGSRDLFDESEAVVSRPLKQKSKTSAFMSDFRDLQAGDYVVHVEHGIGQYCGLKEIDQGGTKSEFMILEYAEGAKLYVPLTRLDLVQKYRSAEGGGTKPPLARLGSGAWAKTKAKVKKAMKDMTDDLLKLYAQREAAKGHAFPADTQWQKEFEDAFDYNETDDQIQSIAEIKKDMESGRPMDRLLCGDVGYGKTEVAMRAAFKAVSDNKQVAVLAPTTVLAFQHYETFKQRFAAFPITIEMVSSFRTAKQQKEIIQRLEAGKVDILIGTHRLLSKDVKFTDLGLVVVDEEQRFGVRHKERLKQLKKEVDVLTMSATPIPRTLHMSLVGLRDMSVIETPPRDRIATQTVVTAYDDDLLRAAIEHELERGGQAYFVHNRVDTIYEIAAKIQKLVPKARLLVGHGQMSEGELEKVMLAFMRHEADILVATTIIENGLDIPLCNTIIINRADRFGLSELYQLRGRVGRSNRRAYAYLLIPADTELTPIARRRLAALKEFSDLGAGFKLAALDLELRGAGNLLGGEQSGHIDAIGFELYTSMLERTVREMKGEVEAEEPEAALNLGLNIRIPAEYIAEENQRLRMYKRVAGVENESQLADVTEEMTDRYGALPPAVENLVEYARLRLLSRRIGVAGIDRKREQVHIKFTEKAQIDPEKLARFVAAERGAQFSPSGTLTFTLKSSQAGDVLRRLREMLTQLAAEEVKVA